MQFCFSCHKKIKGKSTRMHKKMEREKKIVHHRLYWLKKDPMYDLPLEASGWEATGDAVDAAAAADAAARAADDRRLSAAATA